MDIVLKWINRAYENFILLQQEVATLYGVILIAFYSTVAGF
jgi:hypothetical protein